MVYLTVVILERHGEGGRLDEGLRLVIFLDFYLIIHYLITWFIFILYILSTIHSHSYTWLVFFPTCCSGRATALFLKVAMLPLLGTRWRLPIREGRPAERGVLLLDGVFSLASSPRRTSEIRYFYWSSIIRFRCAQVFVLFEHIKYNHLE